MVGGQGGQQWRSGSWRNAQERRRTLHRHAALDEPNSSETGKDRPTAQRQFSE